MPYYNVHAMDMSGVSSRWRSITSLAEAGQGMAGALVSVVSPASANVAIVPPIISQD
jgi:hypothetical protein